MEKEYINIEQSLALKELGFDEPCIKYYWTDGMFVKGYEDPFNYNKRDNVISAPLYQQAFRWFRENHDLCGIVLPFGEGLFDYRIYSAKEGEHLFGSPEFNTYEEAELDCLNKLIEIVKNSK